MKMKNKQMNNKTKQTLQKFTLEDLKNPLTRESIIKKINQANEHVNTTANNGGNEKSTHRRPTSL